MTSTKNLDRECFDVVVELTLQTRGKQLFARDFPHPPLVSSLAIGVLHDNETGV